MKNKTLDRFVGAVCVTLAGFLWGTIGIFIRDFSSNLSSMEIVTIRSVLTVVILFIVLIIFKRDLLKIKLKDIWCFIGSGICSIIFFNYCYFKSMSYAPLSVAAVLLYTAPAIVMVLSTIIFKEKITVIKISALLLAILSCILSSGILVDSVNLSAKGILFGLGAGFGYALYSIFSRIALNKGYKSLTIIFYTFLFALIGIIPFADWKNISGEIFFSWNNFGYFILFAIITTVLPYIFYTYGLTKLSPSKASIIASVEPVSATVVGFIFFNETPSPIAFVSIACILLSIILLAINKDKK